MATRSRDGDTLSFWFEDGSAKCAIDAPWAQPIEGNDSADYISGGAGNDAIYGGPWSDFVCGDEGDDTIHGGVDYDYLTGGLGTDLLDGAGESAWCYDDGVDTLVNCDPMDRVPWVCPPDVLPY